MYVASVAMARDLPPRRPTTNAASSIRSQRLALAAAVSCLNSARSSSLSASPIAAIMQDAPRGPALAREHAAEQALVGESLAE